MSKERSNGFMVKLMKFIWILLAISVLLAALYIGSAIHVKNSIRANLQPVIDTLKENSGALNVDARIYARPGEFSLPWAEEFHVYLTANVKDLRRISRDNILEILNNGTTASTEYSYGWDVTDYAIYTRTVTDSITGKEHPVFVTISDGTRNFSLKDAGAYRSDATVLHEKSAEAVLHPVSNSLMLSASLAAVFLLACLLGLLSYVKAGKANAEKADAETDAQAQTDLALDIDSLLEKVDGDIAAEQSRRKKAGRTKARAIALSVVAVLALAAAAAYNYVVIPSQKYEEAIALLNSGDTNAAYAIFEALGGFQDSETQRKEIDYSRANQYIADGNPIEAFVLLSRLDDYRDSGEQIALLLQENPHFSFLLASPGEVVTFGSYEQDNNTGNGTEPIEWIVLYNEDGEVYLLSKYVLDVQPFNTRNVRSCSLRDWLKTEFSGAAFAAVDTSLISRIGLLPEDHIDSYDMKYEDIAAQYTPYALAQDPSSGYAAGLMWWVDGALSSSSGDVNAPVVWESGAHGMHQCDIIERCGVRPAIWLFADPETLLPETQYSGEAPEYNGGSTYSSSKCSSCNGTGKKLVTFYSEGDWGETSYASYTCTKCNGTGRG